MRALRKTVTACLAAGTLLTAVACGGSSNNNASPTVTVPDAAGRIVDIYSSLPLKGPDSSEAQAIVNGMKLALVQAHGQAGIWNVHYWSLNDARPAQERWDADATSANARQAAEDPKAVYYVGELSSAASEVSIPILNQAKVPQVSPASTYVGLTLAMPGNAPDEPRKYYPSGVRTFLRIVPTDSVQAATDLIAMKEADCKKVALASGARDPYGTSLAGLLELEKGQYGVTIVSNRTIDETASDFHPYAASIKREGADCMFLAGTASRVMVEITEDVNAALPRARLFGSDQMCTSAWTNQRFGGVPAAIDPLIECSLAPRSADSYRGSRRFLAAYRDRYGAAPDPYAIYGYEAMKLGLDTIAALGVRGDDKLAVLQALFSVRDRRSVLGTYSFDSGGDTTLKSYGLYRVGASGDPVFYKTITPADALS